MQYMLQSSLLLYTPDTTITSFDDDCIAHQEIRCYIELTLLRSIVGIKLLSMVPNLVVLTTRMSLHIHI